MERLEVTREEGAETAAGTRGLALLPSTEISHPRQQSSEEERQTNRPGSDSVLVTM